MKIVLASKNPHKLVEISKITEKFGFELVLQSELGVDLDVEENGTTFEENARIKALAAYNGTVAVAAEDSGLEVDALGGAPGIYSARYAARCNYAGDHDDEGNNQALLKNLEGVEGEARGGAFVCAIACVLPDGREFTVRGEARGRILDAYHGNGGFGYDPLFYYEPLAKTFAELTPDEKNAVSHRGNAIALFAKALKNYI